MSANNPINLMQDRRQWLKTSATALGAAVLPLSGAVAGVSPADSQTAPPAAGASPARTAETSSGARFFTPAQHRLVEELSETIIPADSHSGGAKAAKVADFIEQRVGASVDEQQKALWREGLRLMESMSQHYNGKSFVDAGTEEKIAVIKVLSDNDQLTELPEVQFFHELKSLTVRGFYTSKIGIHDDLDYKGNRILEEFVGCGDPTPPAV
ncbi:MAG TPA: gluconate 2-dehydrogenase subunit 3 family protein [Candidatus Acidoferrum sp.]|nr:gluconate 2-dehydrogenase subunit 3 family protein [Candidatus Acidoferrum sp.]